MNAPRLPVPHSPSSSQQSRPDTLRFLVNGVLHEVAAPRPTQTLLQYLREDAHLCGTKEGCGEGDCGACTVLLHELDDSGALRTQSINACIRLLPSLDGKAVQTVEGVCGQHADEPHPVQQAMVEHHGSQCGFCTPGFIMSLKGLWHETTSPTPEQTRQAISGNLCRCTGYRPIVDSTQSWQTMRTPALQRQEEKNLQALRTQLKSIAPTDKWGDTPGQRWYAPTTTQHLSRCLAAHPDAIVVAGATDVGLWVTKLRRDMPKLVFLGQIRELDRMVAQDDGLEIRANVSLERAWGKLVALYPSLSEVASRFASVPVRHSGTLCGNVANGSPIGDAIPVLLALNASVVLESDGRVGGRRVIPLQDLYLGYQKQSRLPGEWVYAVRIPALPQHAWLRAYKVSKRSEQDISAVFGAFMLQRGHDGRVTQARIALGGMAATPIRARATEAALLGQPWNQATMANAREVLRGEFKPLDDMRASAAYRATVCAHLLERFFLETQDPTHAPANGRMHATVSSRVAYPEWVQSAETASA